MVTVQAIVMFFGALTAAGGLLLLFLRQDQGRNTIKVFGQEFVVSTPALVVFLSGCAIFVLPLLRESESLQRPAIVFGSAADGSSASVGSSGGVRVGGDEKEPNDQLPNANTMRFGTKVRGVLPTEQDRDVFKFRTPADFAGTIRVILRKPRIGYYATVAVFDSSETAITTGHGFGLDAASVAFNAKPAADYYIRIVLPTAPSTYGQAEYELEVRQE